MSGATEGLTITPSVVKEGATKIHEKETTQITAEPILETSNWTPEIDESFIREAVEKSTGEEIHFQTIKMLLLIWCFSKCITSGTLPAHPR